MILAALLLGGGPAAGEEPAGEKYPLARHGKRIGAHTLSQISHGLHDGRFLKSDHVWLPEQRSWIRLGCLSRRLNDDPKGYTSPHGGTGAGCSEEAFREQEEQAAREPEAAPTEAEEFPPNTFTINPFGLMSYGWLLEGLRISYQRQLHRLISIAASLAVRFPVLEDHYGIMGGLEMYFWVRHYELASIFFSPMIQAGGLYPSEGGDAHGVALFGIAGVRIRFSEMISFSLGLGPGVWILVGGSPEGEQFTTSSQLRILSDFGVSF